jgi:hypothetical protein
MQQTGSANLFSLDDLMGSAVRQPPPSETATAKPSEMFSVNDLMGIKSSPATTPVEKAPTEDTGDFMRGGGTALAQTPALAFGALGFAGAAGEKAFGTGGAMTSLKNYGLREYGSRMKEIGATAKDTDDVTKAWDKAKQGDLGALVDWAQYGVGYLGGSIVEICHRWTYCWPCRCFGWCWCWCCWKAGRSRCCQESDRRHGRQGSR